MPRKRGRPTVFTEEVIQKLEYAYSNDFNDSEASYYAGLNPQTLSEKYKRDPEFLERMQVFKNKTRQAVKLVINKAIQEDDVKVATWYAEHRMSNEYADKTKNEVKGDVNIEADLINPFEKLDKDELRRILRDDK